MTTGRSGHAATLLASGKVLVAGGDDDNGDEMAATRPRNFTIRALDFLPPLARSTKFAWTHHDLAAERKRPGRVRRTAMPFRKLYDPATELWTPSGGTNDFHDNQVAVLLPSGKVLIAGGGGIVEIYDPAAQHGRSRGRCTIWVGI